MFQSLGYIYLPFLVMMIHDVIDESCFRQSFMKTLIAFKFFSRMLCLMQLQMIRSRCCVGTLVTHEILFCLNC